MRIVFLGNAPWSVPSLAALAPNVVAAVTERPRPAGRGRALRATAVAVAARELDIPVVEAGDEPLLPLLAELRPDVLAVVAYGRILPAPVLDLPTIAPVNLHFSVLPHLRGASPVQSALLRGDRTSGVSVIRMTVGLDAGPVYASRVEPIAPEDDAGSLGTRLATLGADLLVEVVDALVEGTAVAIPQDEGSVTTCAKFGPADRPLRWTTEDAERTVARVRALAPEPGASTTFRGGALRVLGARIADDAAEGATPGEILGPRGDGLLVAAARGTVLLLEVAPAGRPRMSAAAFARGARPAAGERFV